jgi:hypothetical protein
MTRSVPEAEGQSAHRPNGPGDTSPGLRPKADALGKRTPHPCGLKGRENLHALLLLVRTKALSDVVGPPQEELERLVSQPRSSNAVPTISRPFRPHRVVNLSTQGIGLRPRPWAPFSRPLGRKGSDACTSNPETECSPSRPRREFCSPPTPTKSGLLRSLRPRQEIPQRSPRAGEIEHGRAGLAGASRPTRHSSPLG